ncbi:MAG: hypothetical protein JWP63_4740 [Candidatus Solibacter sp.]|jgi:hypothetical protein|nr:hypothetical protein [Candidatus Solibacter sp.]
MKYSVEPWFWGDLTIRHVPGKSGDILRTRPVKFDGTFTLNGPFALTNVSAGPPLPDIEVIARDDATGRSVARSTSARPFVVRVGP